jgi:GT2 family glycosyltransferase
MFVRMEKKVNKFPPDVSVAIVAHNALSCLPATLDSLEAAGCPLEQITVIDVASEDGCTDWVKLHFPGIRILKLESNDGPNPARNLGIMQAETPYVLLLDPDVMVEEDTVPLLRSSVGQDLSIGISSPIVLYADRPDTIQYGGTGVHFICEAVNQWQGRTVRDRGTEPKDIGCASANALLISREAAIKVDLFDERYFMGREDGDFTHRIKLAGYKIMEIPQARVFHNCKPRGTGLYYFQIRNRWYFILKNYQLCTLFFIAPVLVFHEILQFSFLAYNGHGLTYIKAIFGLFKMLPNIPADRKRVEKYRTRKDHEILLCDSMVVPENLLSKSLIRKGLSLYDKILQFYWSACIKWVQQR